MDDGMKGLFESGGGMDPFHGGFTPHVGHLTWRLTTMLPSLKKDPLIAVESAL